MVNKDKIREIREEVLKISQAEAAKRAGFVLANGEGDRSRWSGIETGVRKNLAADTLSAVARALGCTVDELLTRAKPKPKGKPKKE